MSSRTGVILTLAGGSAVAAAAWYAFAVPVVGVSDESVVGHSSAADTEAPVTRSSLDRGAFDVVLWHEPPRPAPPPPPPKKVAAPVASAQPLPPPAVDLLAISLVGEEREAVFYDTQRDQLRRLRVGDSLMGYRLEAITPVRVDLALNGRSISLDLDQPRVAGRVPGTGVSPDE